MTTDSTSNANGAPQQHKQPSRKGKKAWRKNVDITQIQVGLGDAREQTIQGGLLSEKPSDSLFTLDTIGSSKILKTYNKTRKPLKADEILAQRSKVAAISSHKRSAGTTDGILEPPSKKPKRDRVSAKEYEKLQLIAYARQSVDDVIDSKVMSVSDPWAVDETDEKENETFSFLDKVKPIRPPATLKEAPISLLADAKKLPSVPKPRAGTSYNPSFQDWDSLLTNEGQRELRAERQRLRDAELENERSQRIAIVAQEDDKDADYQTEDESAWEGFESDYKKSEWLNKKRPERKTPQEQKKAQRKKEREREEKVMQKARLRGKREREFMNSDTRMKKAIEGHKIVIPESEPMSDQSEFTKTDGSALRRRPLGKDSIPDPSLELVLPDELQDSLRLLKPEGNLLKDRFRNLLLQGKLESRRPIQQAKKKRRKTTEKWTFKDFQTGVQI